MDWVLQLAADLRSNGVDAILDKWHLKEGQDAFAFMERMVTDPTVSKVAVICDKAYVERAKGRKGGVGAESQIMSAELYGKVDQTKFVAIAREKDENGRAYMPAFFMSRIYIDLTAEADFSRGFEQLLRWCFDKSLYVEPELGEAPQFLDKQTAPVVTRAVPFERVLRDPSADRETVVSAAVAFFRELGESTADFTVQFEGDEPEDEQIFKAIQGLAPIIGRIVKILDRGLEADRTGAVQMSFHQYLERLIPALEKGSTNWSADVTKFYALFLLVTFIALAVRNRKFTDAEALLKTPFVKDEYGGLTATSVGYDIFRAYLPSLEARNNRLQLNRAALHADLIQQVCEAAGLPFKEYVEADFLIYLRGAAVGYEDSARTGDYKGWWPTSGVYVADRHSALPSFVRAESPAFRDALLNLIEIKSSGQLEHFVQQFRTGAIDSPKWRSLFSKMDVPALMNAERILLTYT